MQFNELFQQLAFLIMTQDSYSGVSAAFASNPALDCSEEAVTTRSAHGTAAVCSQVCRQVCFCVTPVQMLLPIRRTFKMEFQSQRLPGRTTLLPTHPRKPLLPNYVLRFFSELTFPGGKKVTISCSPCSLLGMLLQHMRLAQQISFPEAKASFLFYFLN